MCAVLQDAASSPHTVLCVDVLLWQWDTNHFLRCSHNPSLLRCTAAEPGRDAVGQQALYCPSVKQGHGSTFFSLRIKWRRCWAFLVTAEGLSLVVSLSVRWIPRNLVLWTLSTAELFMREMVMLASPPEVYDHLLLSYWCWGSSCALCIRLWVSPPLFCMPTHYCYSTTVVSSVNLMTWLLLKLSVQSYISSVNNKGLRHTLVVYLCSQLLFWMLNCQLWLSVVSLSESS